jgi:hypothetical protein
MSPNSPRKFALFTLLTLNFSSHCFSQSMHPKRNEEGFYYEWNGTGLAAIYNYSPVIREQDILKMLGLQLTAGYKLNKSWGLELGIGDLIGWNTHTVHYDNGDALFEKIRLNSISAQPAICFQNGKRRLKLYAKAGTLFLFPVSNNKSVYFTSNGTESLTYSGNFRGDGTLSWFTLICGAQYSLSPKLDIFCGVQSIKQVGLDLNKAHFYLYDTFPIGLRLALHVSLGKRFWVDHARYDLGS